MVTFKKIRVKLDESGKIEIPREYRESLKIGKQEELEISLHNESIIVKKIRKTM